MECKRKGVILWKKNEFTFEDYKKMLDEAENTKRLNLITANLRTITSILIEKGLITSEDYDKRVISVNEKIMKSQYEKLFDDDKSTMNILKCFSDLMSGKNF